MKFKHTKILLFFLLPVLIFTGGTYVHASTGIDVVDVPVFDPVSVQNFDAGQRVEFRVSASQAGNELWLLS